MEFRIKCKFCGELHRDRFCPKLVGDKKKEAAVEKTKQIETAPVKKPAKGKTKTKKAKGKKS